VRSRAVRNYNSNSIAVADDATGRIRETRDERESWTGRSRGKGKRYGYWSKVEYGTSKRMEK